MELAIGILKKEINILDFAIRHDHLHKEKFKLDIESLDKAIKILEYTNQDNILQYQKYGMSKRSICNQQAKFFIGRLDVATTETEMIKNISEVIEAGIDEFLEKHKNLNLTTQQLIDLP